MDEIVVRAWRVVEAQPSGCMLWFDPAREVPKLYRLLPPDGEEVHAEGLAAREEAGYLDKVVSVSALETEAESASIGDH